jgi:tRNA threonylcarbamoyladenosine biosynthesis protein TsaB
MLLALDTSTRITGLALYNGVQVPGEAIWTSQDYHTAELAPAVVELLARSGVQISDLQALAVALGPGSFTGLRIGLALIKGIALARHLPVIGIPSLDALAAAQPVSQVTLAAILQAGRGRLAVGWYQSEAQAWKPSQDIEILTVEELGERIQSPTLVCGELSEEERRLLRRMTSHRPGRKQITLASPACSLRRPSFLAELAWKRWQAGQVDDPATLAPIYLHYKQSFPE